MDRVWTFQEAVLAKSLYFKLKDDYCCLEFSATPADKSLSGPFEIPSFRTLMRDIYSSLRGEVQNLNFSVTPINMRSIAKELRWRNTSKRRDELLAVCILLDLDVDKIFDERDDEKRMAQFLTMVKLLPSNIIFTEGPRLNIEGFRWAPKGFLTSNDRKLFSDSRQITCTMSGVFGEYLVFKPESDGIINFATTKRCTIVDNNRTPTLWFDIFQLDKGVSFPFTEIVLLPDSPKSVYGTAYVAAAVLREELPEDILHIIQKRHIPLCCSARRPFSTTSPGGWLRDRV